MHTSRLLSVMFGVNVSGEDEDAVQCGRHERSSAPSNVPLSQVLGGGTAEDQSGSDHDTDDTDAVESTEGERSIHDIMNEWIYFKITDCFKCTEILDYLAC